MLFQLSSLLLASVAIASPIAKDAKFCAVVRSSLDFPPTNAPNDPLKRNGTSIDVGLWRYRKDLLKEHPFHFTIGPGANDKTHTIIDPNTGLKLAYTAGNMSLPLKNPSIATFILTNGGNTEKQLVDQWTLEKDAKGRTLLGLAKQDKGLLTDGTKWTEQACLYLDKETGCDGSAFMNCGNCFGAPTLIEIMPAIEK